jgi:hypothetical protein
MGSMYTLIQSYVTGRYQHVVLKSKICYHICLYANIKSHKHNQTQGKTNPSIVIKFTVLATCEL